MTVTHKPKGGALLTGTEYEAADSHVVAIAHVDTTGITATDHHAAPAAGPDANVVVDGAGASGTASTFARSGHGHQVVTDNGVASTQAFGDAATAGTSGTIQRGSHKHAMPADPVTAHVAAADPHTGYLLESLYDAKGDLITASADNTPSKLTVGADDTILMADAAAGGGLKWVASATPSTQAMGDAAAVGTADTFTRGDHKHAMPALGFGLITNATPAVSLTSASAFATATTSISAATYADVTGVTVTLASGTWLVVAQCTGSSVNAQAIMHVAITDAANTVLSEGSQGIGASGTASVAQLGTVSVHAIVVATGAAIKMRAARGLTTITGTWVAMDGAGTNTLNNLTDNSDKGSGIFAIRIA